MSGKLRRMSVGRPALLLAYGALWWVTLQSLCPSMTGNATYAAGGTCPIGDCPYSRCPDPCEEFFRWQGWPYPGCCGEGVEPPCHDACRDAECSLSTMQVPEGETEPDCFYCSVSVLNRCDS